MILMIDDRMGWDRRLAFFDMKKPYLIWWSNGKIIELTISILDLVVL